VRPQIVGYGHIGSQLSVLAEAMGMKVIYYDVLPIMPLGSAQQVESMEEFLGQADFVTLHVPELPETTNLIRAEQIAQMKDGSYLINNARGKVVDIPALIDGLKSGKLAGAAVDVFPAEPKANGPNFGDALNDWSSELRSCPNLILTPHIGGSTEEAQSMIGAEVGGAVIRYLNFGSTIGAVNFPEVNLRPILHEGTVRLCHVHLNQPGVLKTVNAILGEHNVEKQFSDSKVRPSSLCVLPSSSPSSTRKGADSLPLPPRRATSRTCSPTSPTSTRPRSRRSTTPSQACVHPFPRPSLQREREAPSLTLLSLSRSQSRHNIATRMLF